MFVVCAKVYKNIHMIGANNNIFIDTRTLEALLSSSLRILTILIKITSASSVDHRHQKVVNDVFM
jgi:hypothetical protein